MIKHVIYGFFGLLSAIIIALAIYLDKPAPSVATETPLQEENGELDTQVAAAGAVSGAGETFEVLKVIDGDTIAVLKGGSSETIRLIGINAPETGQCYTGEATQKLKDLVAGSSVSLELDRSQGERDKYDRLLAYVFTEDGSNAAEVLIEGGFAKEYTYSKPYKYQSEFKEAQADAQTAGVGLWAAGACATAAAPTTTAPAAKQPAPKAEIEQEEPEEEVKEEEDDPPQPSGDYTCSTDTYNCDDFSTHAEAQEVYEACGGASNDVHQLDRNKDGQACESLP